MSKWVGILGRTFLLSVRSHPSRALVSGAVTLLPLMRTRIDSGASDTLAVLTTRHTVREVRDGGFTGFGPQPFSDDPLWQVSRDGKRLVLTDRSLEHLPDPPTFAVTVFDSVGEQVHEARIPFLPVPLAQGIVDYVAEREAASARELLERSGLQVPSQVLSPRAFRDSYYLPSIQPPASAMALGENGEVWVGREMRKETDLVDWMVLNPGLTPVAVIRLPRSLELVTPARDFVIGVFRDELEVVHLAKYRLLRGGGM